LTFTIQNDGANALGSPGTGMGFEGISPAVAVEFDSRGSLGGEIGDNHVAIIAGSVRNELTQVPASFDLNDGDTYYAWVDYNGNSDSLSVYLSDFETKPPYLLAETTIDLEAEVGSTVYFGFTAGTGSMRTNAHEILSWQLDQLEPAFDPPKDPNVSIQQVDLITGIEQPISIAWLPDETMLIAQKNGVVRVASGTSLHSTPFIDISDQVNNRNDRGLLDIAVHPDFENNPYVYLLFTYEGVDPPFTGNALSGPDGYGNRAGRLIKVEADSSNAYRTAIIGSEEIILGKNSIRAYFNPNVDSTNDFSEPPGGVLPSGEYVQDFINSDCLSHTVGGLAFSPINNALFVSIGDGSSYNDVDTRTFRVQDVDSLSGKVLRIDPLTGWGLPDNPYYSGDPTENKSKVYHLGLRNPFRLEVDAVTGELYIGEVGWTSWEEVNRGDSGDNFGWPYYEGGSGESLEQRTGYGDTAESEAFFSQPNPLAQVTAPIYALNHASDGINAIVLGAKLSSDYYGAEFQGNLFVNDLGQVSLFHLAS
jgi:glucose/arabinose dehydrogenase